MLEEQEGVKVTTLISDHLGFLNISLKEIFYPNPPSANMRQPQFCCTNPKEYDEPIGSLLFVFLWSQNCRLNN